MLLYSLLYYYYYCFDFCLNSYFSEVYLSSWQRKYKCSGIVREELFTTATTQPTVSNLK